MRRTVIVLLLLMLVPTWACHERIKVYPPPRIPDVSVPEPPAVIPVAPHVTSSPDPVLSAEALASQKILNVAETNFRLEKYPEAIQGYEAYLKRNPQSESSDRALFNLGISYAMIPGSKRNLTSTKTNMKRLISEFPGSWYRSQAGLILRLIAQVEQLNTDVREQNSKVDQLQEELKRLKEIDLNRRPSRPSE